jgi:hypothetical protein
MLAQLAPAFHISIRRTARAILADLSIVGLVGEERPEREPDARPHGFTWRMRFVYRCAAARQTSGVSASVLMPFARIASAPHAMK